MDCLAPNGVAVHTTEFNVQSNARTVAVGHTVLYRQKDIVSLAESLRSSGHDIELDFDAGSTPADLHVDHPPWSGPHLKIQLGQFVATSIGLIIGKATDPGVAPWRPSIEWTVRRRALEIEARVESEVRLLARRARGRLRH